MAWYIERIKSQVASYQPQIQPHMNRISTAIGSIFVSFQDLIIYIFSPSTHCQQILGKSVVALMLGGTSLGLTHAYIVSKSFRVLIRVMACVFLLRKAQNWVLQWACYRGHDNLAKALVYSKANVNSKNFIYNLAPLHYAAMQGRSNIVTLLINAGADATLEGGRHLVFGPYKIPPLQYAMNSGDIETIKILHTYTPVLNSDLHSAVTLGHINIVTWIMEEFHFDINTIDRGVTPLYLACEEGNESMVRLLVNTYKADINIVSVPRCYRYNSSRFRPLHIAVVRGHLNIVRFLLEEAHADLKATTNTGDTIAHIACKYSQVEILAYLQQYLNRDQLNINDHNTHGDTPLHLISDSYWKNAEDGLSFVLERWKPDVNAVNAQGATPLHVVAQRGELSRLQLLLQNGARADIRDHAGQSPIHYAAKTTVGKHKVDVMRELMAQGISINDQDLQGRTPLHLAVIEMHHNPDTIRKIIHDLHANVNATDKNGKTPYHIACIYQYSSFIDILERAHADPNLKDQFGYSPQDYKNMSSSQRIKHIYSDGYLLVRR